jgi:hypothetical protein
MRNERDLSNTDGHAKHVLSLQDLSRLERRNLDILPNVNSVPLELETTGPVDDQFMKSTIRRNVSHNIGGPDYFIVVFIVQF